VRLSEVSTKGLRQRSKGVWKTVGGAPPAFPVLQRLPLFYFILTGAFRYVMYLLQKFNTFLLLTLILNLIMIKLKPK